MRRISTLVAILFAAAASAPAFAEALVYLGPGAGNIEVYADRESLRTTAAPSRLRPFSAVQVWVVYDTSKVRRSDTRSERSLLSFNCVRRTRTILAYQKIKSNGTTVHDWHGADVAVRYESVGVNAVDEAVMIWACSGGRILPPAALPTEEGPDDEEEGARP